ncbi:MAG: hypothetical protein Q4B58_05500 [Bacteroidales bacterium]|nr:hypothetical protein [Bacteroidales bacterium]
MKRNNLMALLSALCLASCTQPSAEKFSISEAAISQLVAEVPAADKALLEKGVRQAASLWQAADGSEADFVQFVKENYVADEAAKKSLYDKLARASEVINGAYNQLSVDLSKPVVLSGPQPDNVDYLLSEYSPYAHLSDDMYQNKLAFITMLNFPFYSLAEKNELGKSWSRQEWAYARMGDSYTSRVPASVKKVAGKAYNDAENYIASYNIMMGHLLTDDGRRLFPSDMCLLSHWNLRDEIKSNYANLPNANEKQEMIYQVMERIVNQEIPAAVINNADYDWAPYSNKTWQNGAEVTLQPEGAERYQRILDIYHADLLADPYYSGMPTAIVRNFEGSMEVSAQQIEQLFTELVSSEQVKKVAALIKERLGRDLRPYDIWYDGFKSRASLSQDVLSEQTRKLYPTPEAFEAGMPAMLMNFGFSRERAQYIADKIKVEGARGSGHALGTMGRGYNSFLRTRIGATGMDYKGYNIAVHEFGHNVEQTLDTYDIDYYTLAGVPNTGFTETLAFVFQKRDLRLLGQKSIINDNTTLDIFWGMYEIMGVSLVDMYTWRWLYEHPEATAEQLRDNCLRIAKEVWNKYYEPVLGSHDATLLAIYSHMINAPMYLPNYPFGHIVEYQIEEHFSKLPNPDNIAPEIDRIWRIGRLTPNAWMNEAVGSDVSTQPILNAIDRIVGK